MLVEYMKSLAKSKQDSSVVLSISETTVVTETEAVIHRNHIKDAERGEPIDLYVRAREIYYRARRHRPVRAASIF